MPETKKHADVLQAHNIQDVYQIGPTIGHGSYSTVRLAKSKDTGDVVAIKVFKKSEMDEYEMEDIQQEIKVMRELKG